MQIQNTKPRSSSSCSVAFLGPRGTYSHQAAQAVFNADADYIDKQSIAEVFRSLDGEVSLAVVPAENSTFGHVVETYDLLRESRMGDRVHIRGEVTISIQHCLIVRKGTKFEDIDLVSSHEQALGQCKNYLTRRLPNATLRKTPSTAAAAQALLSEPLLDEPYQHRAAICSAFCSTLFDGLEILEEAIQDEKDNNTRFFILSTSDQVTFSLLGRALLRMQSPPGRGSDVLRPLVALELSIARVDRRPSLSSVPFEDVYFVEVERKEGEEEAGWRQEVQNAVGRVRGIGWSCSLLGIW